MKPPINTMPVLGMIFENSFVKRPKNVSLLFIGTYTDHMEIENQYEF
jgi:hypothetical protein